MARSRITLALFGVVVLALCVTPAGVAAPPTNDDFANATLVAGLPFSDTVGIDEATTESGEPLSWGGQSRTIWYSFAPASDAIVRADLQGSNYPTAFMSVYRQDSTGFGGLTKIANGGFWPFTFEVDGGATYYIQAGDDYPYGWVSTIGINVQVVQPPPNDDFADAMSFSVPFSDSQDMTAATVEPSEPMGCNSNFSKSTWYKFTPATSGGYGAFGVSNVNVYTGTSLGNLTSVACAQWPGLYFHADAGTTYYLQVYGGGLSVDLLPPPSAGWCYSPGDPSIFEDVSFGHGCGYWYPEISSYAWDFGDGTTSSDASQSTSHRFAADGDYQVKLTVTTIDGRTNSETQVVHVRTHDITLLSLVAPAKGQVGKPVAVTVGIGNTHYSESVKVDLFKVTPQGDVYVGTSIQAVGVMKLKKAVNFSLNYVFTNEDLAFGKVTFKAIAEIQGARDAIPSDNAATAPPTLVVR